MPMSDMPPPEHRLGSPTISNSAVVRAIDDATAKAKHALQRRYREACQAADAALSDVEAAQDARITRSRCGVPEAAPRRAKDKLSSTGRKAALAILEEGMAQDAAAGVLPPLVEPGSTELP